MLPLVYSSQSRISEKKNWFGDAIIREEVEVDGFFYLVCSCCVESEIVRQ